MKKIYSIIAVLNFVVCAGLFGQVSATNPKEDIVINMKMIEKYQQAEYSENQISFTDLAYNYSFESIKVIANAYNSGEIEISNLEEINNYLARYEKENNDQKLELYSEKKILASQQ